MILILIHAWHCGIAYIFSFGLTIVKLLQQQNVQSVWIYYLNQPADNIPRYESGYKKVIRHLLTAIRDYIYGEAWYLVYDLIEFHH